MGAINQFAHNERRHNGMSSEKKVIISRHIEDLSKNEIKYLLGENLKVKEFSNKNEAIQFITDSKLVDKDVGFFNFIETDSVNAKMENAAKPLKESTKKGRLHDKDDDRGR
jgi:hypothetical protein